MSEYSFLIWIIIALVFALILSLIYKNKEKKDRGFVFSYYRLSYRRKMIRTLWQLPLFFVSLIIIYSFGVWGFNEKIAITLFLIAVFLVQLFYNYFKWKKYEE